MDRCVFLTSTPECVVSSRGETTHEGVDVKNTHHTYPWLIPITTWCQQYPFEPTKIIIIIIIRSKLKLE